MKKVLVVIVLSFCIFVKNTYAETFYGEYHKVDNIEGLNEDEIKKDSYKMYNSYELEYEDMGYLEDNEEYIKDENDYIEEKNIVDFVGNGDEYIKINTTVSGNRKITFNKFSDNLKIYEIEIYIGDEKLEYEISNKTLFESYGQMDIGNINDGDYNTFYLNNSSLNDLHIVLKFNKVYNFKEMKIIVYTEEWEDGKFTLLLERYKHIVLNNTVDRKHVITFNVVDTYVDDVEYSYMNIVKKYKYYKEDKKLLNNYIRDGVNIILDDYKVVDEYYRRDKLILSDNLVIKSIEDNLDNFILYSSRNVEKDCDINYDINGEYKCNFILNDIKVEKKVVVDIKENNAILKDETNTYFYESINDKEVYIDDEIKVENKENVENEVIDNKKDNVEIIGIYEVKNSELVNKNENTYSNKYEKNNGLIQKETVKKISNLKDDIKHNIEEITLEKVIKKENNNNIKSRKDNYRINKIIIFVVVFLLEILFIIKKKKR